MFNHLEIETIGQCNRTCSWCMRNTEPDREAVASYFSGKKLPTEDIYRIIGEAMDHGYAGTLCLSHYNEPLLDDRIVEIAKWARARGLWTMMCSNADRLTEDLAKQLDEVFCVIRFAFYDRLSCDERSEWCRSLFKKCRVTTLKRDDVLPTHFSGDFDVVQIAGQFRNKPCHEPNRRMIINHEGKMMLCCNDLIGRFGLPTIYDGQTVGEMWNGHRRRHLAWKLSHAGGREISEHCLNCPRPT